MIPERKVDFPNKKFIKIESFVQKPSWNVRKVYRKVSKNIKKIFEEIALWTSQKSSLASLDQI